MRGLKQLHRSLVYWQVLKQRQSSPVRCWQLPMRAAKRLQHHAMKSFLLEMPVKQLHTWQLSRHTAKR